MRRLLRQNSLFIALLMVSATAHWAIGYLGGEEYEKPEIWLQDQAATTVSVQLVAPTTPLQPAVDTLDVKQPMVDQVIEPMEIPQLDLPEQPFEIDFHKIRRLEQQQRAEFTESELVNRLTEFELPAVTPLAIPESPLEALQRPEVDNRPIQPRPLTEIPRERQPLETEPLLPAVSQPSLPLRAPTPDLNVAQQAVDLPRQLDTSEPLEDRTIASQGSSGLEAAVSIRRSREVTYPRDMLLRGVEGLVKLTVVVTRDGRAGTIRIQQSSGHPQLDQAAITAARGYQFQPARRNGQAIATTVTLPVRFTIRKSGK
jgi:protein TonB